MYHMTSDISLKKENPLARSEGKGKRRKDVGVAAVRNS